MDANKLDDESRNGTSGENRFQKAIRAWRDIDLSSQVPQLDAAASNIIHQQKEVMVKRKDLAQKTKDFRRMDEPGKIAEIKGLLKLYQSFIDEVSNQSKTIQSAFLQLYTPLSEAPDPYPLLEASMDSLTMVEDTFPRLTRENEQLQRTVNRLTTQLDERDKELDSDRSSKSQKAKEVEDTWNTVLREKENSWNDEKQALLDKNGDQEKLIKELKASQEISQRLSLDGNQSQLSVAASSAAIAELEIISSELERTNIRIVDLEKRNSQLTTQLAQSVSHQSSSTNLEDEPSFVRVRAENQTLLGRLESLKEKRERENAKVDTDLKYITRELDVAKRDRDDFRSKIHKWKDYDIIKQELELLKRVDFGIGYDDNVELESENASGDGQKGDRLEQLLMIRNQKLSDELSDMRLSQRDISGKLSESESTVSTLTTDVEKCRSLIQTLESDLVKMQEEMGHSFTGTPMSIVAGNVPRLGYPRKHRIGGRISPTSSIISGLQPQEFVPSEGNSLLSSSTAGTGILPMVTAQRDRFKKQAAEHEAVIQQNQVVVQSLRSEVNALKKDNMQLYEKNRYLTSVGAKSSGHMSINMPSSSTSGNRSLDHYRKAYENNLSPFAAFKMNENTRGMRRLSLPERMLLKVVKYIVQDRLMCNLFSLYFIVVHIFLLSWLFSGPSSGPSVISRAVEASLVTGDKRGE